MHSRRSWSSVRLAVTGASGVLGSSIFEYALGEGVEVIGIGRGAPAPGQAWRTADVQRADELVSAFDGVDAVIHAAAPATLKADDEVLFARRAIDAAEAAGVGHLVYVSIVNVERNRFFEYYRGKHDAEKLVAESGLGYTIVRIAQFHEFVAFLIEAFSKQPVALFPPGAAFQPIDTAAAAERLIEIARGPAQHRVLDIAGPQVLAMPDMFDVWKIVYGVRKPSVTLPLLLPLAQVISRNRLIDESAERLGITWETWLRAHRDEPNRYAARLIRRRSSGPSQSSR